MALNGTMALGVGKGYTNLVALGLTNVTVDGTKVTFELNDGSTATVTLPTPKDGKDGADGKSLEYNWDGTRLGVRVQGTTEYSYVDLKGAKGEKGDAGEVAVSFVVVDELPASGENGVMYLVRKASKSAMDIYDEYMFIDGAFEHIGSTEVNLSDYYTKTEVDNKVLEHYSTDETVVGTWINGEPIYRRIVQTTMPTVSTDYTDVDVVTNIGDWNVAMPIRCYGFCEKATFPSEWKTTKGQAKVSVAFTSSEVHITSNRAYLSGLNAFVVMEYTKK